LLTKKSVTESWLTRSESNAGSPMSRQIWAQASTSALIDGTALPDEM
jgi:hypothetical protein